jgi:hypothetical protein
MASKQAVAGVIDSAARARAVAVAGVVVIVVEVVDAILTSLVDVEGGRR